LVRNLRIFLIPAVVIHLIALVRAIPLWSVRSRVVGRFGQLTIGTHATIDLMLVAVLLLVFALSYAGPAQLLQGRGLWRPPASDAKQSALGVMLRLVILVLLYWFAWRFAGVIWPRALT
jgi:Kef-type K+ transport system membrane component KefB